MNNIENMYKFADSLACETKLNEPMKKHTSFKIGGNAAVYIKVDSLSKLCKFVRECKLTDTKYFLLGNGSNILVDDNGMDCAVIKLDGDFKEIRMIDSETVYCGAGATLAALCKFALNNSLSGLEFAWEFRLCRRCGIYECGRLRRRNERCCRVGKSYYR